MLTFKNGETAPMIGLGTYKITETLTQKRTKEIVKKALEIGYRYIDTAAFYGNEREIGAAIRESGIARDALFLATKVWKEDLGYDLTRRAIRESLSRLDTPYIDLLMIHWPKAFPEDARWKEKIRGSWKAMEEAVTEGKVRILGLSNFLPHHIMALMETAIISPAMNQLELHAGHMQYAAVVYCQSENIHVQAWSPLGRTRIFRHPALIEMAERYEVTVSDLLLRFLLQQGISVIPKATSEEHLQANLMPAEFVISPQDMAFLLCLPSIGWAGEHPDFPRAAVDTTYQL